MTWLLCACAAGGYAVLIEAVRRTSPRDDQAARLASFLERACPFE